MKRSSEATRPILTLAGPTAAGKTEASLQIAEALDAEIVSVDSRQLYTELEIGTATPSRDELLRVPHHFINERSVRDPVSSGQFARQAEARIASILERGKQPLLVGGSTLYLYALQFGLADIPEIDASVREALQGRLIREGIDRLFEELATVDPAAAATMDPTKSQRIVRALEVYHGTGRALSAFHGQVTPPAFQYSTFVIQRERKALYERIDRRAEAMLDDGLIDEVKGLIQGDYDLSLPVFRTIGYREPLQFLRGEIDREEMVRLLKRNTRRYAKRQLTWFRRFDAYTWVDAGRATQTILACNDR